MPSDVSLFTHRSGSVTARGRRPAIRVTPIGGSPAIRTGTRGEAAMTAVSRIAAATTDRAGMPTEATGAPEALRLLSLNDRETVFSDVASSLNS